MGRVIRRFIACDGASLIAAMNQVCSEGCWMSTRRYEPTPAWAHALAQSDCLRHLLLVVEANRALVGWCRLFPDQPCNGFQPEASLGIGLLQPYRNRGIGTALVNETMQWGWSAGIYKVTLSTRADNTRAIHVFAKCGFEPTRSTPDGLLKMECGLGSPPRVDFAQGEAACDNQV